MSDTYPLTTTSSDATSDSGGAADTAREQASHVAEKAADTGGHLVDSVKEETGAVAGETTAQARDLFNQTKDELVEQAGTQQQRVASGLHSLSEELTTMAGSSQGGVAGDLVAQAASRTGSVADWLEQRDPGSLVEEVRKFAREKPGTFIAIAAGAGLLVGRLTRSVASAGPVPKQTAPQSTESATAGPAPTPRADALTEESPEFVAVESGLETGSTSSTAAAVPDGAASVEDRP
jgi:ElaB/YqjD/DUF883 family membrane-anchored ribosome-binding protein